MQKKDRRTSARIRILGFGINLAPDGTNGRAEQLTVFPFLFILVYGRSIVD